MKHMGMVKGFSFPVTQRLVGEEDVTATPKAGRRPTKKHGDGAKARYCVICGAEIVDPLKKSYCSPTCASEGKARRQAAWRKRKAERAKSI